MKRFLKEGFSNLALLYQIELEKLMMEYLGNNTSDDFVIDFNEIKKRINRMN